MTNTYINTKKFSKFRKQQNVLRGDLYYADLDSAIGSEQGGIRPVVIIQNDIGNKYSPTVVAAAITSRQKSKLPTHVEIEPSNNGLTKESIILLEQVRTIDKQRLKQKIGKVDNNVLNKVNKAIAVSLGLIS